MKYRFQYMSLTELGRLFYKNNKSPICATSHDVGRWLIEVGLRDGNKLPSTKAQQNGFVIQRYTGTNGDIPNFYWETIKTIAELEKAGYQRLPNPPLNLIQHDKMIGPYNCTQNHINGYDIQSTSGDIVASVYDQSNASEIIRILNMYDRCLKNKKNGGVP